ncbi:dynamin family protein [Desulfobacula phenolica]|uniref:Dynamin family protein n=1 Tax=Desulfobacula phenolica TaxID=90732 RepID=A0A1H2JWC3_9BACT|nr:dynamin family protein [Desulfobacula phenolica]SDU60395.1 Dynamin family protein [Desulfobacula phenolica]
MTNTKTRLNSIEKIVNDTLTILHLIEELPQMSDTSFKEYQTICQRIPEDIRAGCLKIAVVGVVKSGKSTFVNSLIGKELVKRGAGVLTSITTRIRKGKKNQANLYFKSWDDINSQLQKALMLFPHEESGNNGLETPIKNDFDIRRKNDRNCLKKAYQTLINDFSVTNDEIMPETILIRHALQGFDMCKDLVQADETLYCFESKEFDKHKPYTSDPDNAFYIKDVCLNIFGKIIDPNIEIADCQGADSTDPAQLAQILTYLESSNLIIYCISSRTGLRQSDMTFLKRIKNLGLLDNILFINNCDLTEHENLDDLIKIETSICANLEFLDIQPKIFSFSSLYNLFLKLESKLTKKDLSRLKLWQEEKKMVQYCDLKTREFESFFTQKIDKNRFELLISNHLKRLGIIIDQLDQRTNIFINLLSSDKLKEKAALETLEHLHQNASRLESIVANSIQGAVRGLKDEIDLNLKEAFVQDQFGILKKAREYIRTASIDVEKYRFAVKESGFNQTLYLLFQDFKRKLDLYGIEQVNPQLKKIVEAQEKRITSYFQSLFDSYQIDLLKADHYSEFENMSNLTTQYSDFIDPVDIDKIKKILGLQLPTAMFEAKYTSKIKANVFADFGLQTLVQILSCMFDRKSGFSFSPGLEKAALKIKKKHQKLIRDQFEEYHMSLRTNYFIPLIEAGTREFKEKINKRFNRYHSFKKEIEHFFSLKRSEKKNQKKKLLFIKQQIQRVAGDIASYSKITWK